MTAMTAVTVRSKRPERTAKNAQTVQMPRFRWTMQQLKRPNTPRAAWLVKIAIGGGRGGSAFDSDYANCKICTDCVASPIRDGRVVCIDAPRAGTDRQKSSTQTE